MDTSSEQIIALYEQGMNPELIAEQLNYEVEAVKLAIVSKAPEKARAEDTLFEDDRFKHAVAVMGSLLDVEDPNLQYRASKFIINENKGRHDIGKDLKALNIVNFNIINERLARAREITERAKQQVIDVPV